MKHPFLIVSLVLAGFGSGYGHNLIVNPGFETDSASPIGKPDFFRHRMTQYHSVETYTGPDPGTHGKCARFNNTSAIAESGYFYSNYNNAGAQPEFPVAESGAVYEATVQCRVDSGFTGDGVMLQIFLDDDNFDILGNNQSEWTVSQTWITLKVTARITGRVGRVSAGVNFNGKGSAWADNLQLRQISPTLTKNGEFEVDLTTPSGKPDYFRPRSITSSSHSQEQQLAYTYLGRKAAKFNSPINDACYFYGPYDAAGNVATRVPVSPGDSFKVSAFGRTAPAFTGSGLRVSLLFWNSGTFVSRVDSPYSPTASLWTKFERFGTVPQSANEMSYSVESFGVGEAWMDQLQVLPDNLILNSSAETNIALPAAALPDFWLPRNTTLSSHQLDQTPANVYAGATSMLFNNSTGTEQSCYFYGPADAASAALSPDALRVSVGETYTLSAYGKTAADFIGSGIRVSLIFWKDATNASGAFHSRADSPWVTPAAYSPLSVTAAVPAGADRLTYSVEYKGQKKAWFDKAELRKTDAPWHLLPAPLDAWEPLEFSPPAKATLTNVTNRFITQHNTFETNYSVSGNPVGSWGIGYGAQSGNHPLVRASANAAMGYLAAIDSNVFSASQESLFAQRAREGLDWLLTQQLLNGAFPWWWSTTPTVSGGAEMYEGGLAGMALIRGYQHFNDPGYLNAANDVCDYFLTVDGSANANFNAFAILALTANYQQTQNQDYLDKALELADIMLTFQLESGMWSDAHNQLIQYHGIISESLARILLVLPAAHPKRSAIAHALFKAVNHMRLSQNSNGTLLRHFTETVNVYDPHNTSSTCVVHTLPGIGPLSDSMSTLSVGALSISIDYTQGYSLRALGALLDAYY